MYKVVTHTITEEHYTHPVTANIGLVKHRGNILHGNLIPHVSSLNASVPSILIVPRVTEDVHSIFYPPGHIGGNANIKVKLPSEWGSYDAYGDLSLHGDMCITGDLTVEGTIISSSAVNIGMLDSDLTSNVSLGNKGDMAVSPNYAYLCVDKDTWIRWAIDSSW